MNQITDKMLDAAQSVWQSPWVPRVAARAIYIAMERARMAGEQAERDAALARRSAANTPWDRERSPPAPKSAPQAIPALPIPSAASSERAAR